MTPLELKSIIVLNGIKIKDIAKVAGRSQPSITRTIYGINGSLKCRQAIADAIGKPVAEIWPDTINKQ